MNINVVIKSSFMASNSTVNVAYDWSVDGASDSGEIIVDVDTPANMNADVIAHCVSDANSQNYSVNLSGSDQAIVLGGFGNL